MTNGQISAVVQAVAFLLLFTIPVSLLVQAIEPAAPALWASLGASMLALLELMAFSVWLHWTGRAVVRCRECQSVHGINMACSRCGGK